MTAGARSSNSPTSSREELTPRSASLGARARVPRTPTTAPSSTTRSSTRCRKPNSTRPRSSPASTGSAKTRTTSGPVPQVRWKRGTELPWPVALPLPRSAQPTNGSTRRPSVVQVVALLAGRELDVRLGPLPRPDVLVVEPVEAGRAQPVLEGELAGVLDAHPALLGGVDEEQPAEGPERLAAEVVAVLLVEDQHAPAGLGQLVGGDEAGEAGADDDDVGLELVAHARWVVSP